MPVANEETTMEGVLKQIMDLPYDYLFRPVLRVGIYNRINIEIIVRKLHYLLEYALHRCFFVGYGHYDYCFFHL